MIPLITLIANAVHSGMEAYKAAIALGTGTVIATVIGVAVFLLVKGAEDASVSDFQLPGFSPGRPKVAPSESAEPPSFLVEQIPVSDGLSTDSVRCVQPNTVRGGWDVTREGSRRASFHTGIKGEAIKRGRQILRNQGGGELRIKNKQGQIVRSEEIKPLPRNT